ncbi:MAG: hypothetical protein ACLQNG_02755 [Acidimicrobiales bacterium]
MERLERLEEAVRSVILYVSDAQPSRLPRSVVAGAAGGFLLEFLHAVESERDLHEADALGPEFVTPPT